MTEQYHKNDPYAKREAEKYERPVSSREFIMEYLEELGKPASFQHLCKVFKTEEEDLKEGLRRRLRAMEREGQIFVNRRGKYMLVKKLSLIRGRVQGRKDGYGFLLPDDGSEDIFLSAQQMQRVFSGDVVLVQVIGQVRKGRREGIIVEILESNTTEIVGVYHEESGVSYVIADKKSISQDIVVQPQHNAGAKPGEYVVVRLLTQPSVRRQATGQVIEILGDPFQPGLEIEIAVRNHALRHIWPDEVSAEAQAMPNKVQESDMVGRKDLRNLAFVTIDGQDAKDFDDAVYCQRTAKGGGWNLFVAIADVSYYVRPNTALDQEAELRGNSVYFPRRVIPMLPEKISNGLCSLVPNEDRLVMVCEMSVDDSGKMQKYNLYEGVIRSHARLTYKEVAKYLADDKEDSHQYFKELKELHQLYKRLHRLRSIRGALDFETTETRIIFDDNQKIERIIPIERNDAHKIIEECMLMANVATAKFLVQHKLPLLFRVHAGPELDRLQKLRDFLNALGLRLSGGDNPQSLDYARLLDRIENRPDAQLIRLVLLRSLAQAIYTPENVGHFGLAYDAYCHFTSPIRRYPDLIIHRAIRHALSNESVGNFEYKVKRLKEIGTHCSITERAADLANRDVVDWLKCQYMMNKVGNEYDGIISDVTGFGVFVELKDVFVEGLVHITALEEDYYTFDKTHHRLVGKKTNTVYKLGDSLRVKVARVNVDDREIDFVVSD